MRRVLIVDDSKLILAQLSDSLSTLGYEIAGTAADGADAVEKARALIPDIVLMDILMPGELDGIDAARTIRESLDIPVIFLSGLGDEETLTRVRAAGAYGFISKPGKPAELAASIEIALKKKESENEIQEIFRDVVENTNDLIYVIDGSGTIRYVNERMLEVAGYSRKNAIGKPFLSFLTPESRKIAAEIFKRQMKGEDIGTYELEIMDNFGNVRTIEARERLVWEEGRIVSVRGIGRDVTERKRAAEELVAAREQYRLLAESAVEGIAVLQDGIIKYANPALLRMGGFQEGGVVGQPFIDFVHPDERKEVLERFEKVLTGETDTGVRERRYLDRQGSVHIIENVSLPITWEGKPAAIIMINDVTEARLIQKLVMIQRDIGILLGTADELVGVLSAITFKLMDIPGVDCGGIYLAEERGGTLRLEVHRGLSESLAARVASFAPDTPEAVEIHAGKTFVMSRNKIEEDPDLDYLKAEGVKSLAVVPVFDERVVVGSISVGSHTEDTVSDHVIGSLEDIAVRLGSAVRRIKDQELLAASEKKYRTLTENAKEGIVVIQDGVIKYVNPNAVRMSGYSIGELIGRPFEEHIYPEDREGVAARYAREIAGENILDPNTYRVIWKDGSVRWVEGIGIPIDWEGRNASLSFIEDITERKRVEGELIESERKFRSVFETSRDFMYIATVNGDVLDYNSAGKEFFGYTDEEIARLNIRDLYADPERRAFFVEKVLKEGYVENHELQLKKKDGTIVDALVTVVVRKDGQGNIIGLQGNVKDITQMRRLERQLLQSEKLSSLGTMISGIAHELNNPLTAIMGNAEILTKKPGVSDDIARRIDVISKESVRAAKIISSLLSFAREHKPERRLISINDCVMESYKLREYNLEVSNIRVDLSLAGDLHPTYADPYQIQQVFINIINNARDALIENRGGRLLIRSFQRGGVLVVEFEDDGPGIEPENLKRIFDPFFTTKDVGQGTGLGLSTAYGIINEHGGGIEVTSKPGKGSRFTVTIPVTEPSSSQAGTTDVHLNGDLAGKRILVVEDERYLRDLFVDALAGGGSVVETATSAEDAIAGMNKRKFDAVITDIKMPGAGGIELYRHICEQKPELAKRVIFVTGDTLNGETKSFLTATDCVYLEKPFRITSLLEALAIVLRP